MEMVRQIVFNASTADIRQSVRYYCSGNSLNLLLLLYLEVHTRKFKLFFLIAFLLQLLLQRILQLSLIPSILHQPLRLQKLLGKSILKNPI